MPLVCLWSDYSGPVLIQRNTNQNMLHVYEQTAVSTCLSFLVISVLTLSFVHFHAIFLLCLISIINFHLHMSKQLYF